MEALAAVGLAGNLVQFIDFTCKLFDQATSIYHSQAGAGQDTQSLQSITKSLEQVSTSLYESAHQKSQSIHSGSSSTQASVLIRLAKDCELAAGELLSALDDLKAEKPESRWSSFRAALKSTWKAPQVEVLEKRLNTYRSQLILQLQVMQRLVKVDIDRAFAQLNDQILAIMVPKFYTYSMTSTKGAHAWAWTSLAKSTCCEARYSMRLKI